MRIEQLACGLAGLLLACDGIPSDDGTGGGGSDATGGSGTGGDGGHELVGTPIDVPVPETGRVYVDLDTYAVATTSDPWDIAFEGYDVFTNGGASGDGLGAAFGPLPILSLSSAEVPTVPFLVEDRPGGAFVDWYDYDSQLHAIYSRYHVLGVKRGDALYKVQILGYYGDVQGAPVSAIYSLRYALVESASNGATTTLEGIDGTAGGPSAPPDAASACVSFATGEVRALTLAAASADMAWDLCFRRDAITVNGALGGPGTTSAVNLDERAIATETLEEVVARTAASEKAKFDAVTFATLDAVASEFRGDGVVSAFHGKWLDGADAKKPASAAWLVRAADGEKPFSIAFETFTAPTAASPGTIRVRVREPLGTLP